MQITNIWVYKKNALKTNYNCNMKIISVKSDRELWSNINLWEKIGSFQNITLRNQTNVLEGIYIVWMLYKIYVHLQKKNIK